MTTEERNKLVMALGELFEYREFIADARLANAMDNAIDYAFEALGEHEQQGDFSRCPECNEGLHERGDYIGSNSCPHCGASYLHGADALQAFRKQGVTA